MGAIKKMLKKNRGDHRWLQDATARAAGKAERGVWGARGTQLDHSLNINNIFIYFVCGHLGIFECIYLNVLKPNVL